VWPANTVTLAHTRTRGNSNQHMHNGVAWLTNQLLCQGSTVGAFVAWVDFSPAHYPLPTSHRPLPSDPTPLSPPPLCQCSGTSVDPRLTHTHTHTNKQSRTQFEELLGRQIIHKIYICMHIYMHIQHVHIHTHIHIHIYSAGSQVKYIASKFLLLFG